MKVSDRAPGEALGAIVENNRKSSTDEPEVLQVLVNTDTREDTVWPYKSPNHGCSEEDPTVRAGEAGRLVRLTNTINVAEGPVQDGYLDDAAPERSNSLGKKRVTVEVISYNDRVLDLGRRSSLDTWQYNRMS